MKLPVSLEQAVMEADSAAEIPQGAEWQFEPKWDGFRCLAFRDGDEIALRSKAGKPLGRYFPDVVDALLGLGARRFVLDGELTIPVGKFLSFDDLLQRIHPAESRVRKLAAEHAALFIVFDMLLAERGNSLVDRPLETRRPRLESFADRYIAGGDDIRLSPATGDRAQAARWLAQGGGLDGVIAKRLDLPYLGGTRDGMVKVKNLRTADCVVGGFRYAAKDKIVGSLLLGLYDEQRLLHHVGYTSSLTGAERKALTPELEKLREPPGFTGKAPGGPSRWSTERTGDWEPLETRLVAEVRYDHFSGGRFRHGTKFMRWRPDKAPAQCLIEQVARESRSSLKLLG